MDPMQALATLDEAVQTVAANRQTHAHLIRCVNVLRAALAPKAVDQADGSATK